MRNAPLSRRVLGFAATCFVSITSVASAAEPAANSQAGLQESPPNVLMICIDDLNDWTGFLGGHPDVKTPNMDALARQGRNFANAHCAVPVCSASRISIMSGMAATTHGSYELGPKYEDLPALKECPTLHGYFKANGYVTISGGKVLHHGFGGRLAADIDMNLGRKKSPSPGTPLNRPSEWSRAWDWGRFPANDEDMAEFQLANSASKLLKQEFEQPFFMSVGFFRPHVPLYVPPRWFQLYDGDAFALPKSPTEDLADLPKNFLNINDYAVAPTHQQVLAHGKQRSLTRAYLASISFVDHCVGLLVDALNSSPHADNTLIVLWSDHGFHLSEKQHWAKRTLWEESTRVPLLISGPGIQPGPACHEPASLLDIYPTLVELCNLPAKPDLEGISLLPQLNAPHAKRKRPAITSSYFGNHSIRSRDWRLTIYDDGAEELYDHRTDSDEYQNLAGVAKFQTVRDELASWIPEEQMPEFKAKSERARIKSK